jgi:undecaprenyl-diphosphatase
MFEAIVLGIVQGLTEFIPVSSSAHLIVFPWFFDWQGTVGTMSFSVALHFGTLIALLFYFRNEWGDVLRTANKKDGVIWKLLVGTVPAGAAGLMFHDWFEQIRAPLLIVFTLCLVSILMIVSERFYAESRARGMEKISMKDAVIIGIAQSIALVPGISRSGITIIAGLSRGIKRDASAKFSFLLSTPAVAGASLLEAKNLAATDNFEPYIFLTGIIISAVTGFIAIKFLLRFFQKHTLRPFAYYRFLLAFVIIISIWTRLAG